jgi:hypothetical protein
MNEAEWKYPNKNQFPEDYKKVLLIFEYTNKTKYPIIAYYISRHQKFFIIDGHSIDQSIKAWCELPDYNNL